MPRPTTKDRLLTEIQKEREALEGFLDRLSLEQMTQPGALGTWSVKDVLAHLVEWEQMFLGWYATGKRGELPTIPAKGFTWGQLPQLNQQIFKKHCDRDLEEIQKQFESSYRKMLKAIRGMTEEELFTRGYYAWTNKNALVAYIIPNTSSHYRWARTQMHKQLRVAKAEQSIPA